MTELRKNPPWPVSLDVERQLPWLTRDLGFKKVEEKYDPEQDFGNSYVTYSAGSVSIRFVRDGGEVLASNASCHLPGRWYILGQVCEFLSGRRNDASTLAELGGLFRDTLEQIELALGPNFEKNKPRIEELEARRFKEYWDKL